MDTPGKPKKKTRDPHKNKINQKRYRQRKYAAFNGMEEVRAHHRQRYYERMARMKAAGEYEAFKAKKSTRVCGATTPCRRSSAMRSSVRT